MQSKSKAQPNLNTPKDETWRKKSMAPHSAHSGRGYFPTCQHARSARRSEGSHALWPKAGVQRPLRNKKSKKRGPPTETTTSMAEETAQLGPEVPPRAEKDFENASQPISANSAQLARSLAPQASSPGAPDLSPNAHQLGRVRLRPSVSVFRAPWPRVWPALMAVGLEVRSPCRTPRN